MTKVEPDKRKRVRTSKVRTGCLTCNPARHVKCGEEKPECLKCTTTGRKCEGYSLTVSVWNREPIVSVAKTTVTQAPSTSVFQTHELRSLRFFLDKTIHEVSTPFSQGLWSQSIPLIAQREPSIKHALVALSKFHERFTSSTNPQVELGRSALKHYNVAIRELLSPTTQNASPVIGLLCCLLFFVSELLQSKFASAIQLFRSGRRIIHELRRSISQTIQPGFYRDLFQILKEAFRRAEFTISPFSKEMNSELSFHDCYGLPDTVDTSSKSEAEEEEFYPTAVAIFNSLPQAIEGLRRVAHSSVSKWFANMSSPQIDKQRLANWCTAFESLKQTMPKPHTTKDNLTILVLEVWWRQVELHILAVSDAPNSASPMWWDQHQATHEALLDYLEQTIRLRNSNLKDLADKGTQLSPSFCLETGQVTHLMSIISHCRDPLVRRKALALIRLYNRQEGLLQCGLTIDCCQRAIEIEEGDRKVTCAADVPPESRIVDRSMHFQPDEPKFVIKYLIDSKWITEVMTWSITENLM